MPGTSPMTLRGDSDNRQDLGSERGVGAGSHGWNGMLRDASESSRNIHQWPLGGQRVSWRVDGLHVRSEGRATCRPAHGPRVAGSEGSGLGERSSRSQTSSSTS